MPETLPTGLVTYLFTDIEGSTRLLHRVGDRYADLLDAHHNIIRRAITDHNGVELRTEGDAFFAVFTTIEDGTSAAVKAQRDIASDPGLSSESVKVRMGIHSGEATLGGDNYTGIDVHIAARVANAANGGQILVTDPIAHKTVMFSVSFVDLGGFWLKDIEEPTNLHAVIAEGVELSTAPPNAANTHPRNAPRDLSSFIGRDREVSHALEILDSSRVTVLTGPGGTGKTRLAIKIATLASNKFRDGAFFVPLAGITDPESVPNSLINALGFPASDASVSPIENVVRYLRDRNALLIVDNCEHILTAIPHIQTVLAASPKTKVLATSRTPLGLRGERDIAIPPLDIESSATQLFVDRATEVNASFALDESNADAVRQLVARLDGLPLAIELAASRARMMSPESILATLDPLALTSSSTSGRREQTLADTIRWSYELLTDAEQALMRRMAAFPAGADIKHIDEVCRPREDLGLDLINGIGRLVEHSLIVSDDAHGAPRFRMLETIREFSVRRLDESPESDEIRNRHTATFLAFLESVNPHLEGPDPARWMDILEVENVNIQTAFDHAVATGDAEAAQRIVALAWRFWQTRGHLVAGAAAARAALALDGSPLIIRARAIDAAGSIAYWMGDSAMTRSHYEKAVTLRKEAGITDGLARALYNLSFPVSDEDGVEASAALLDEALALASDAGDRQLTVLLHMSLSRSWLRESPEQAIKHADDAIAGSDEDGDPITAAWALNLRGVAHHIAGNDRAATADIKHALGVFLSLGDLSGIAVQLTCLAEIARTTGDDESALFLVGGVKSLRGATGLGINTAIDDTLREFTPATNIAALCDHLVAAHDRGFAADLDEVTSVALAWEPPIG